jgi:hypothetical protein
LKGRQMPGSSAFQLSGLGRTTNSGPIYVF